MPDLWLGPDLDADLLELVDYPDQWPIARSHCRMLQLFQQQIGADDPTSYNPLPQWVADLIPNYYPRLANADFFERLGKLNLPLAIETPGLKAWSPDGVQAAFALQTAFNRVRAAGYDLTTFSLDDPLGASVADFPDSPWTVERAVGPVVHVLQTGDANGVRGGITEAYPLSSAAHIIHFFELIQQAGYSPSHMHLDVDEQAAKQQRTNKQIAQDFNDLRVHCQAWGIPFGIILNGQRGDDPQSYRTGFWEWHDFALRMLDGMPPDRWILESWKKNSLPVNLPESSQFSHTGLLREVAALNPFPEEPSMPTFPTPPFPATNEWVPVRVVTQAAGTTLANPDGTVLSLNPSHNTPPYGPYFWDIRKAGTADGYERCEPGNGTVGYAPLGEMLVFPFKDKYPNMPGFSAMVLEPLKL